MTVRVEGAAPAPVLAAGALTWRDGPAGVEVLLVHRPRYDDWSIPKGKLDKGETFPAAAVREVQEETGFRVRLHRPLPAAVYLLPDGRSKIVQYWTATVRAKTAPLPVNPQEIDEVRWVPLRAAEALTTRQSDHVVLQALARHLTQGEMQTVPIIIQRHAAALSRAKWRKGEKTRPLNAKGKKQAEALPDLLDAFDPRSIVTSPWKRCTATVKPFARGTGLRVTQKDELTELGHEKNPSRTAAVMDRVIQQASPVVVCTHRPVLPTVIEVAKQASSRSVGFELPRENPYLAAGEALVLHTTPAGRVVALERHLPNIG